MADNVLGQILTGGSTGAVESIEANRSAAADAEALAAVRQQQNRRIDIDEAGLLLRKQEQERKLARDEKINSLTRELLDNKDVTDRVMGFGEVIKMIGDRPLTDLSPEESSKLNNMISKMQQGGEGVAITPDGLIIPFGEDEEGNPIFMDLVSLRKAEETAKNRMAGIAVELQTLNPSIDVQGLVNPEAPTNPIRRTLRVGNFAVNAFEDGTIEVPNRALQEELIKFNNTDKPRVMSVEETVEDENGNTQIVDTLISVTSGANGVQIERVELPPAVQKTIDEAPASEKPGIIRRVVNFFNSLRGVDSSTNSAPTSLDDDINEAVNGNN